ncbi:acyltransferase family protein [Kineococcus sp. SYSU DK006]|uniref:acyltransferase family protein n=1 Tax=Kineococcus sp. SYSU DK006 TaxID=3383127 RepID=UPI003D7DAFB6
MAAVEPVREFARRLASPPGRDPSVDTLRGLACLLVVLYHVRGGGPTDGLRLDRGNPWSYLVDSLVYLRMPLFSFLSGYVYALRPLRERWPRFAQGKARRLLVPMLVVGTAFALVRRAAGVADGGEQTPWYLWHVVPVAHFWFLEAVFWVFLLVGLADRFRLLERWTAVVPLIGLAVLADAFVPSPTNVLALRDALFLLPFFLSGVAAHRFGWRTAPRPARAAVVAAALLLALWSQLGLQGVVARVPERHDAVAALLGVTACLSLLLVRRSWRPLAVLGGFSFTVYTCHVFGTSAARLVLERVGASSVTLNVLVGLLAGIAAGVLVELVARRSAWARALVLGGRWPRRGAGGAPRPASSPAS